MKHRFFEYFVGGRKFKKEFKKQLRMLIIITLGFTIAFTWRQTIFDLFQALMQFLTKIQNSAALSIPTSIFITIVSILMIYLASYYLKDNLDNF